MVWVLALNQSWQKTKKPAEGLFHTDLSGDMHMDTMKTWTTSVYYINTNNGYTEFNDGTKIESVENSSIIYFDVYLPQFGYRFQSRYLQL